MIVNNLPKGYHFEGILICKNCWHAEKKENEGYQCKNTDNTPEFGTILIEKGLRKTNCEYFNSPKQLEIF